MNPIFNALLTGYGSQQVLGFLTKAYPSLHTKINKAIMGGYSADKILQFLSATTDGKKLPDNLSQNEIIAGRSKEDADATKKLLKTGLGALGGLGTMALSQGAQQLQGMPPIGPNAGPQTPNTPPPGPITNPNQPIQPPQNLIHGAKQPTQQVPVPLPNQPIAPPLPPGNVPQATNKPNSQEILSNLGLLDKTENMLQAGTDPNAIIQGLPALAPDIVKKMLKDPAQQQMIHSAVLDYAANRQQKQNTLGQQNGTLPSSNQPNNEAQPIEAQAQQQQGNSPIQDQNAVEGQISEAPEEVKKGKGDVVQLPDGEVGTIDDLKKDHAVVEIDGKKRPVKLDQIENVPIPQKDLADLHDDLIKGIEKESGQEVSRNVEWAGYEPDKNRLAYLPWDGNFYIYDDISPEDAKLLSGFLTERKTTGKNFIGLWEKGTKSPIGAAMSALIQRLQKERGGKGNEYSGKFQKVYSATEPALKAKKIKEKKLKDEERKRKKGQR